MKQLFKSFFNIKLFSISKNSTLKVLILLAIIALPSFYRMLRPGIYSTQDFHYFRLVEYSKCVRDLQIPCRWSPDSGLGYGEPIFNFYTQLPYALGEVFHLATFSEIDSFKILFILSLIGSAFTMYILSKKLWKGTFPALVSSIFYVYAPYRALDVWVRGALPEALSFVLFPLILLKIDDFIEKEKLSDLLWFCLSLTLLVLTHNLSLVLFSPVLIIWIVYKLYLSKKWKLVKNILASVVLTGLMASFYILPVIFESKYITLGTTTQGYFDFRGHFATLYQILFSRFWGYGGSVFGPEDGLSLSVGLLHWIIPLVALGLFLIKKEKLAKYRDLLLLIIVGWFALFLTHNKSTMLWLIVPQAAYIQFPWRFLGIAVFCFSLASGAIVNIFKKYSVVVAIMAIFTVVFLNGSFFREDIWYKVSDADLITGTRWQEQSAASIGDYWPKSGGNTPTKFAPNDPEHGELIERTSNTAVYKVYSLGDEIEFPITYFPGWIATTDGVRISTYPGENGLVAVKIPPGENLITLNFRNTPIRTLGNVVSLVTLAVFIYLIMGAKKKETKKHER